MALTVGTNSYNSRANADIYFADSLRNATWSALLPATKDQALVEATRVFERQSWQGAKEDSAQTLAFPRTGLTDCEGNAISADDSLTIISEAQYEYALLLSQDVNILQNRDATGTNTRRLRAGSAEIEFFRPQEGTRFPLVIHDLIGCFLASSGASFGQIQQPFASGVDQESSFTDRDRYGLTEGL